MRLIAVALHLLLVPLGEVAVDAVRHVPVPAIPVTKRGGRGAGSWAERGPFIYPCSHRRCVVVCVVSMRYSMRYMHRVHLIIIPYDNNNTVLWNSSDALQTCIALCGV